jgi:glucose-1-phosphate adenylyltransferase
MFVLTQFNSTSLNAHIKNTYHFDSFTKGFVDVLAAEQTPSSDQWFQGTADAVRQSMHHLVNHQYEYILILSGDQLYQMNFQELGEFHYEKDADLTIATIPVVAKDAPGFGIMKVNEDSFIESFIEKPALDALDNWASPVEEKYAREDKVYLASMGIYIFKRAFLEKLFADHPDATDFGKEIIPEAINGGFKVASYPYGGYWTDIGTIASFFEANISLAKDIPEFNLYNATNPIYTRPRMLAPSKVFGTILNDSVLAEGSIVHAKKIENSIVGIRSRIGKNTEIIDAIVMGNDYYETIEEIERRDDAPLGIGENCFIQNAIIDKDCRIGHNVIIKGGANLKDVEEDTHCIREGIVVLKKKAYIPDNTRIGL